MTKVKICGLSEPESLDTAIQCGAAFVGLAFYPPSPRHISLEVASSLAVRIPQSVGKVGLTVDAGDSLLEEILTRVPLDMLQLHGEETPERVREIRVRFGLPVMKAIRVANADDLAIMPAYAEASDWLLFDTKSAKAPGGTGESFDWTLLSGTAPGRPWMLAGGISAETVADALGIVRPDALDLSSAVESAPGRKDPQKIRSFFDALNQLEMTQ